MSVEGKTFVITGGATGIGAATARVASGYGANVVIADLNDEAGEALASSLPGPAGAIYAHCDVTNEADVKILMKRATDEYGRIDVLHNNAGVHDTQVSKDATLDGMTKAEYMKVLEINLVGPWLCAKHAVPEMRTSSNPSIINAGSTGAVVGFPGNIAYGGSKGGVVQLTKDLAVALAPLGIRCVSYSPSAIQSDMLEEFANQGGDRDKFLSEITAAHLVHRVGRPEEVGELVCFLASDRAEFINGCNYLIDAGALSWRGTVGQIGMD